MSAQVEEGLRKMFAAYGRKPLKQQWDVYVDWAGKVENKTVLQIFEKVILNEEKLPTIAKLQKETKAVTFEKRKKLIYDNEDCWYCQGTVFLPILCKPYEFSPIYYIRCMDCKCIAGTIKEKPQYFKNLQFEKEAKQYPDLSYPQIVDKMKPKFNKNLKRNS